MRVVLRNAVELDEPFLMRLEEICMREYAIALWGIWRPRPAEHFTLRGHRIIVVDNNDIGCVATDLRSDHVWIDKLYIHPSHQRLGIGAQILRIFISEARNCGLPVRLSVLTTNPASAFYAREGLTIYEKTPERLFMTTSLD
jgi:GNAT superfamily N-acetyltransferase